MKRLLTSAALLLGIAPAFACICASYDPGSVQQVQSLYDASDLVATIVVEDVHDRGDLKFDARLTIEESFKGELNTAPTLIQDFSGPCVCYPRLMKGRTYLVFLTIGLNGNRQSGPIVAFPDAEDFIATIKKLEDGPVQ